MVRTFRIVAALVLTISPFAASAQDTAVAQQHAKPAGTAPRFLNPPGLPTPNGYSHVVEASAGRTIYISGQLPLDKDGKLIGAGDFAAQAERVFANLDAALTAAGASFEDVIKLNMYVTDMKHLDALRAARDRYIAPEKPPASTLVEVKRFVRDGAMVEIDATAFASDSGAE